MGYWWYLLYSATLPKKERTTNEYFIDECTREGGFFANDVDFFEIQLTSR